MFNILEKICYNIVYMKKIIILLGLLCIPITVSADDDQYYTIYDEKSDTNEQSDVNQKPAANTFNELGEDKIETRSQSIIEDDLDELKNEVTSSKIQMYNEIRKLRQSF